MKNILFSKISDGYPTLTKQIFSLIHSILWAKNTNKKIILLDYFISENIKIPCNEVFDIDKLNKDLAQFEVVVLDKTTIEYKINALLFNDNNKIVDKSDKIDKIIDPPSTVKEIFINYSINGITFSETYPRMKMNTDINLYAYTYFTGWINEIDQDLFNTMIMNIEFKDYLKSKVKTGNIIHILNEELLVFSQKKNVNPIEYQTKLNNTYIHIINEHMNKNDEIILISNSKNDTIINFLNENKYNYKYEITDNSFKQIEILYYQCNIFVGNFNIETLIGDAYSYYLSNKIKCKKKIMLDITNL